MRKLTTFLIFLTMVLVYMASDAQKYSLDDVIDVALENNQTLKNSTLDVIAADYRIKEVKSALMPTINITGQSLYYRDLPAQYAPASSFGGPEGQFQKLTLGVAQNTTANLQVSQNLYNHAVMIGLKAARVAQETSLLQSELTRENLVYNVTSTYYSIQVLQDNLLRLSDNISNLEKTSQINGVLKDNELVPENIHNRMLINLENLRNQYENQKLLLDKNLSLLKYLMNIDASFPLEVEAFDYNEVLINPETTDISNRTDLRLQQANLKLSHLDKKSISAGYFPTLTNSFTFGYAGYNDEFGPFKSINNDWIQSSYVALTLRIPVFDGFMKHNQIKQKEIAIQRNMNFLYQTRSNAEKEVQDAIATYVTNKNLLSNNKKSLELAEKLFESSRTEYENGISSLTDLLNAQNDLTGARTNYSAALLNVKLAELGWKKANGTLITKP
jgi:outer membrane protein